MGGRILFINPHYPMPTNSILLHPPLAFGYMSQELKKRGHHVLVLDLPLVGNSIALHGDLITDYAPDLIGITCVTQSYCQLLEIAEYCKQLLPDVPIVTGGPHVTFTAEETLTRHPAVDFVLGYDADFAMADLADCILATRGADIGKVNGLSRRVDGEVVSRPAAPAERNLDLLPSPDRSLFDMATYLRRDYETVAVSSRGCPSRCAFCSTTQMGRFYRYQSVERFCDELEELLDFGFSSFFFGDDTFSGNASRAVAFCDEVKRRGLEFEWTSNMRVADARPETLDAIRSVGGYRVFVGIETVKKDALKLIQKGTTPDSIHRAVDRIRAAGLELHSAYIIGVPGDTEEDIENTLDFMRAVRPTVATFNTMEVRPGTSLHTNPSRYGVHVPDQYWYESTGWTNEPTCYTDQLSTQDIKRLVEKCYHEFCSPDFLSEPAGERIAPETAIAPEPSGRQKGPQSLALQNGNACSELIPVASSQPAQ